MGGSPERVTYFVGLKCAPGSPFTNDPLSCFDKNN
jgi:hypothetical protein